MYRNVFILFVSIFILVGCSNESINLQLDKKTSGLRFVKYDFDNYWTHENWDYRGEAFDKAVKYLNNLKGKKVTNIDMTKINPPFYGVDMNSTYLLICDDYLILSNGDIYNINSEKLVEICSKISSNNKIMDLNVINNHRYISINNNKWDTRFMIESNYVLSETSIEWEINNTSITGNKEIIEFSITNYEETNVTFGEYMSLEVLVSQKWFQINDMTTHGSDLAWHDILIGLEQNKKYESKFNLKSYNPLPQGKYRFVKEINVGGDAETIAIEFEIE